MAYRIRVIEESPISHRRQPFTVALDQVFDGDDCQIGHGTGRTEAEAIANAKLDAASTLADIWAADTELHGTDAPTTAEFDGARITRRRAAW